MPIETGFENYTIKTGEKWKWMVVFVFRVNPERWVKAFGYIEQIYSELPQLLLQSVRHRSQKRK